ncbi:MAG: alanine:cation symporter family protein [Bacteroidaceae bacterium]|nr:alanine:cation symporter family protein [Bacteroidaceae bacterium]MBR4043347.1 alanine:cation symporter family protein [Bacteroidaceae bacterium]
METMTQWITSINDVLWTYILIIMLLGCAVWFTIKTRFVQFRMLGEMLRLLGESTSKGEGKEHHISSFQAFMVSLASRVGTGNLAGVATAITVGGPGAVFWMWLIALLGSSSAFIESTLAQLYKVHGKTSYIGGPAYYMKKGLKKPWMGILFAILIIFTFAFAFNTVQSNTICAAFEQAFQVDHTLMGIILTVLTLMVIFGGIQRIAKVSSIIVPVMALGYILLALVIVGINFTQIPAVFKLIVSSAFGWEQALGGGIGAALMQGIKRGLFSNEAGMGSAPNVAATADVTHPVKQGLIQALGVFSDTLVICTCTAFIILFSGVPLGGEINGVQLTQMALDTQIGSGGSTFVAIAILFFAFSSVIGNYYYGEANLRYITHNKLIMTIFRLTTGAMVMFGALASLDLVWSLADVCMALMTICNLIAIVLLGKYAFRLLEDYREQKRQGIKEPTFTKDKMKDIQQDIECW